MDSIIYFQISNPMFSPASELLPMVHLEPWKISKNSNPAKRINYKHISCLLPVQFTYTAIIYIFASRS